MNDATTYNFTRDGHRLTNDGFTDMGSAGKAAVFRCVDCGERGDFPLLRGGDTGCPARPDSLGRLSVCPGGERCLTHPDTTSAQWRAWKESDSMPISSVPHYRCTVDDFAKRAATQYIKHADAVGMKMGVWAQEGYRVGPEGGTVASFQHASGSWDVVVDTYGNITAHPRNNRTA